MPHTPLPPGWFCLPAFYKPFDNGMYDCSPEITGQGE